MRMLPALALAFTIATAGLPALAHEHPAGHEANAHGQTGGHDHSQHSHARIVQLGQAWEAGVDVVDWSKPVTACPLHPQIVTNKAGSSCPITSSLKMTVPTTRPAGADKRLGLVLLPTTQPKQPITDARVQLRWAKGQPVTLSQKDGYYWADLPASAQGPFTLDVSRGKQQQRTTLDHL